MSTVSCLIPKRGKKLRSSGLTDLHVVKKKKKCSGVQQYEVQLLAVTSLLFLYVWISIHILICATENILVAPSLGFF